MGDIPQIKSTEQHPVTLRVPGHWIDHCFQGRAVLPAVEAMQLLVHWARRRQSNLQFQEIGQARFEKFLDLPLDGGDVQALCKLTQMADGTVRAALMSKIQAKSAKFSRTIVHAQVDLPPSVSQSSFLASDLAAGLAGARFKVNPEAVYEYLVPFGPAYRNIAKEFFLTEHGAIAHLQAPDLSDMQTDQLLGSPFVLDAAFHTACVWGQRYADVVAFPVGFEKRMLRKVTQPGRRYVGRIFPVRQDERELVFDIWILDLQGQVYEVIQGVRMRDVSRGHLKPPAWIKAA